MTARGDYLKALVDPTTGRISVRELAKRLSEQPALPEQEAIRRTLQRHIAASGTGRDVSSKYVLAISEVLGLDPADWPAATSPPTKAALRQRVVELEQELARLRPASAQRGEP